MNDTVLLSELDEGETLLWSGQPSPRRTFRRHLIAVFAVVLFVALFMGMLTFAVADTHVEVVRASGSSGSYLALASGSIWAWVVAAVGAMVVALSFVVPYSERAKARRTWYGVTDHRAVIVTSGKGRRRTVRDFAPDELCHLTRREHADGTGDIRFESCRRHDATIAYGFVGIDDARGVQRILHERFGDTFVPKGFGASA